MTSHRFAIVLLGVTVTLILAGCLAKHKDVSSKSPYSEHIGKICDVLKPLRAHGVTHKLERENKTDAVSIWNPGSTGPEVTFLVYLKPGHTLKLLAARECTNCPFDLSPEYRIQVTPEPPEFAGKPAHMRAAMLTNGTLRCAGPT